MVSHDLAVISHMCERLAVMKTCKVVEALDVAQLRSREFSTDYTRQLMVASEGFVREA
jgi:peptide/nickel transport system ATP-binding protein